MGLLDYLLSFVNQFNDGGPAYSPFPELFIGPNRVLDDDTERLFSFKGTRDLNFATVGKKILFNIIVKCVLFSILNGRPDTKRRTHFPNSRIQSPSWRVLYKSPIPKRSGDLQWHVLYCTMANKFFVTKLRPEISPLCNL